MIEDFRDLLAELLRAEARFLVVGAHALGVHGVPRATVDLDIWVERSPANGALVWRALVDFGAPLDSLAIHEADLLKPDVVVQLGLPPWRIDILTSVTGIDFEEAWNERIESAFEDLRVPYLGRAAFIRNKRATGRQKDLSDLESLGEG